MQLKPLRDLVLVQREAKATHTPGGLALPDTAVEESLWVIVQAAGPLATKAKVGSKMLLRQWCGMRLEEEKGFMSPLLVPQDLLEAVQEDG
jgi:co-chaperonin GroES (HSP10)